MSLAIDRTEGQGRREEFHRITMEAIAKHGASVRRYCLSLTKNAQEAEDLEQETWLRAYLATIHGGKPLVEPYLIRMVRNTWVDGLRPRRLRTAPLEDVVSQASELGDSLELQDAVHALVQFLPMKQQLVFLLREAFGFTASEIAAHAGQTVGAVKACLHRARATLERETGSGEDVSHMGLFLRTNDVITTEAYLAAIQDGNPQPLLVELSRVQQDWHVRALSSTPRSTHTRGLSGPLQLAA